MVQLEPYLIFNGNCAEAMRFYERTLEGKLDALMTVGESPGAHEAPPGSADRIMHARLRLGDRALMASDGRFGEPYEGMKNIHLALSYPTAAEGQRIFDALGDGGRITMPFQKTFWADGFGMLVDRFGTPWMVSAGMTPP